MNIKEFYELICKKIDEKEIIEFHRRLVQISSISGFLNPSSRGEEEAARFIAEEAKKSGLKAELDEVFSRRPNVYVKLEGKKARPTLIFNSHMDVMPAGDAKNWKRAPAFSGEVVEGRIYGRGASDAKGPLAAMVMSAKVLKDMGVELTGNLLVTGVVDEEVSQKGTLHIADKGMSGDFAIVGEPTSLQMGIAHKGNAYFEITTTGKSAHASLPERGVNAIYKMAKIVNELEKYHLELGTKKHKLLGSPSLSVGTIIGGDATNAVPEKCTITVDRRYVPPETSETAKRELEQVIEALKKKDSTIKAEIRNTMDCEALEISEEELVVKALKQAGEVVTSQSIKALGFPYGTDGWILSNRLHIPTVLFGPGSIDCAHGPDEFIEIDELVAATKIYALTAFMLLR